MTNTKTAKTVKHEAHYGWDGQLELPEYWTVEIFEDGERVNFARIECGVHRGEIKAFETEREALEWIVAHDLDCESNVEKPELYELRVKSSTGKWVVMDRSYDLAYIERARDSWDGFVSAVFVIEDEYELEDERDSDVKRYEDVIDALVESAQSVVRYNRLIDIAEENDSESSEIMLESLTTKRDSAKNDYFVAVNTVSFIYGVDVSKIRSDVKYRREFLYD